ncbi:gamma-crystallin 1-like [Leptodactylus fuscus]|uniref:gamma-crystallin 1-like n=1 Tax=Leptodactylus fuscus TaxID=238119 RepID=UPI003F4ED2DC
MPTVKMVKVIFYENKNFQGCSYECGTDSSDLSSHFIRCNSIRVEDGNWIFYEEPNYRGRQYFVRRGEYPELDQKMGINDSIRSCQITPQHHGAFHLRIYEKENFSGRTMEFTEDCPHLYEQFRFHEIHFCNVLAGHWIFYEEPNFRGHQYYLKPGQYKRYTEWGAMYPRIGSFKRLTY